VANRTDPLFVDPALLANAEAICTARLDNEPQNRSVWRSLLDIYRKRGKIAEAAKTCERLLQLDPKSREIEYLFGVLTGSMDDDVPHGTRPAPFVVERNFLPGDLHDALLSYLIEVQTQFVPALITSAGGGQRYAPEYRDTLDFVGQWNGRRQFVELFEETVRPMIRRLHVPEPEAYDVDLHVRAYQDGHFFRVHMDAPANRPAVSNRVVSFVYFFHRVPRSYGGGELLLFDTDPEANTFTVARFTQIVPEDNALVMFPSRFYHCVTPVTCPSRQFADSRFVVNGFVHERRADDNVMAESAWMA
jgi:hypothetical protein